MPRYLTGGEASCGVLLANHGRQGTAERTAQGYRRFRCLACGKLFNERWRLRYKLSLRDLTEMFQVCGFVFSYEAVRDWEAKLTPAFAQELRRKRKGNEHTSYDRR